jgi:hypothetical protein
MTCKDIRTTLLIRNIPNKYQVKSFAEEIDNCGFKGKYDLLYLPIDYSNGANLGFAFINLIDPMHILSFYECFRGKKWRKYNSSKICELAYAKIQGKKNLIFHFQKGSILREQDQEKLPLILPTPNKIPLVSIPNVNNFINSICRNFYMLSHLFILFPS